MARAGVAEPECRSAALPAPAAVELRPFDLDRSAGRADFQHSERALLNDEERARADRFRFEVDRRRYTSGRAQLRTCLAGYLGITPAEVAFSYGEHGRPALHPDHPAAADLVFNLAHSEGFGIFAAAVGGIRLGVDIEILPAGMPPHEVADHFFAANEVGRLFALPTAEQALAFYQCWTRKEAYLKALGGGLSIPLDAFEMAFGAAVEPALLVTGVGGTPAGDWVVRDVSAHFPGAVAAVVAEPAGRVFDTIWRPAPFSDQQFRSKVISREL